MAINTIVLNWLETAGNEEGFNIYRSTDGIVFNLIDSVAAGVSSYTAQGAGEGQQYWFKVAAFTYLGESAYIQTGPFSCFWILSPPSLLSAIAVGDGTATLTWQDNSSNESGSRVYVSIDGANFEHIASVGVGVTAYNTDVVKGLQYWFRVTAYNANGESDFTQVGPLTFQWTASYQTELTAISRTPMAFIIITLDYCGRTFGTSPCLATGTPCYNTWGTCKYASAYTNVGKEYKFSRNDRPLIAPGIRPYLKSYKELPTEIDPEKGLAINARVTLEFYDDENDTDVDVDPYLSQRSGIQGSFWKKLLARNKFYQRRQVVIKKGFKGMAEVDYVVGFKGVIDSITGPVNSVVKIVIKDYLKKADAVDVPTATKGKTTDNPLSSSATTINLDAATEYAASGWVRIDEEIVKYTGKSGNQLTGCIRGEFSTTAAQHSQNATVQQCAVWQGQKPFDIISDILQNRVGIAALDIDITGAQADQDKWLPGYAFTGVISEPTKASDLIAEICESAMSVIWWDNEAQLIKFRVSAPIPPGSTVLSFNDAEHIITGSTTVDRNEGARASLVVVYYKKKAIGKDNEDDGYAAKVVEVDADKEGSKEYGGRAIKKIYSRWIVNDGEANHLSSRTISWFNEPPVKLGFSIELKDDDLKTGDLCRVTTDDILDTTGTPETRLYQVLKKEPKEDNEIAFLAMDTRRSKRYAFIAPNGTPNYPSATAQQRESAFIGNANNKVNGGIEDGYYIW